MDGFRRINGIICIALAILLLCLAFGGEELSSGLGVWNCVLFFIAAGLELTAGICTIGLTTWKTAFRIADLAVSALNILFTIAAFIVLCFYCSLSVFAFVLLYSIAAIILSICNAMLSAANK